MNSTKLHSLSLSCGTQAGETTLGGFGLQRWRARRRIKEGEKLGGDFSKAGAADRESNVEHMQAAASSNERGKTGEDSGAWQQREKRKRKGNGSWAGRFELGSGGAEREDERR